MKNHRKNLIRKMWMSTLVLALMLCATTSIRSQALDSENRVDIKLDDGTSVILYGQSSRVIGQKTNKYYMLPTGLKIGSRPDGTPEFLFMKFTTEERADQGGIGGGLIHFLMEWGLTPEQRNELSAKLGSKIKGAKLMGSVPMQIDEKVESFKILSATLSNDERTSKVVTSGKAPLIESGKVAAAAQLDKYGAQLLASTFERAQSITDLSVVLDYYFTLQTPAVKGKIVFDWSKFEREYDNISAGYRKKDRGCGFLCNETYRSYNEIRSHYDYLRESEVIRFEWEETLNDERVDVIREAFFQYFLNAFTEKSTANNEEQGTPTLADTLSVPNIRGGAGYKFRTSLLKKSFNRKTQVIDLKEVRLAVKQPYQIVGNLASWYNQVKDNPKCVYSVNLNDPFFQHRDIRFVLDLEAKDMFDEAVNYVTVNVRKKRSSGNDYEDHLTIDKAFVEKNGITGVKTYARGEDTDPTAYEYQTQWSLRGGNIYPKNPKWEKGAWEGVTLEPPVTTRTIELEADIDELQGSDITRVTAQIRYKQFGEEKESNIQLSTQKGEPIIAQKIFLDRDTNGYVYRLILNHKTEKKLVLPWEPMINDNYIYANIPEDILDTESEVFKMAKETGEDLVKKAGEKVLDKFEEVFKSK
ncbi:hypothetical protein [Muriicola sp. Z0-33]|uniref:hypothetical protein n=1 Tax=Muriicola sp. Z0-33 TaxID=2816957 RepID=UPI00223703A0|nr:hypothetical protein [Muriicola sp. Z0-33]MCW5516884.1 hypothetical protein [Muriicola sp. Z0-33]